MKACRAGSQPHEVRYAFVIQNTHLLQDVYIES